MFGGRGGRGRGGGSGLGLGKRAAPGDVQTIRVARRVFVGNLSYRTSWQDLKDHFAQAGKGGSVVAHTLAPTVTSRTDADIHARHVIGPF